MLKMWMLNVDVDHQELGAILWSFVLSIPTWLSPTQGTYKDIHRHRVKYTYDDVHECIEYLVPCLTNKRVCDSMN